VSKATVKRFLEAFGRGDVNALVKCFDQREHHGSACRRAIGETGSRFLRRVKQRAGVCREPAFETQAFAVDQLVVAEGTSRLPKALFTHRGKATQKNFGSDWALMCVVSDDRVLEYRFFDESAALGAADPATAYQA
jgi:uncharacterized protein